MERLDAATSPTSPPPAVDASCVPTRRPSVAEVEVDGERVLLDEVTGSLHLLDPLASIVWSFFDGSASVDDLAADLSAAFGTDVDRVRTDVLHLAGDLTARGLLVVPGAAETTSEPAAAEAGGPDEPRLVPRPGST